MLSLGIVWNSAQKYNYEIINEMENKVKIVESFEINLGDFFTDFIYEIYQNEEKWKVDKKHSNMITIPNKTVAVVVFEFNSEKLNYHPQKNKNVYTELNNLKVYIRDKYSKKIDNYFFDNLFHCTDDLEEFKQDYEVVKKYLKLILVNNLKKINSIEKEKVYDKRKSK